MTYKYRLLLAVLLTLIAIGCQVALAQTKTAKKDFTISNIAVCNCNVTLTPALTNPSSCNLTNGSVALTVSGGSGSFTYRWKNQSGTIVSSAKDLTNAGTGYYFLEVKDTNAPSCGTYYSNYTLSSNFTVAGTIKDNNGCVTANGAITVTAAGGSGSYTYSWRFPDASEVKIKDVSGVKAGTYYLTVTDTNLGCTITRSFAIKSNSQLTIAVTATTENTSCASPDGGIAISTGSGSGQYNYTWYNMQTYGVASASKDLSNVPGGRYAALISDKISGCLTNQYFEVPDKTVSPKFVLTESTPNTNCKAPFNGSAKLEISGTPGPYNVTWTDGTNVISTDRDPVNLPAGKYGFTIVDDQTKCKTGVTVFDASVVEIQDESLPTIALEINELSNNTNCNTPNGKIKVTIADPTTPYSFSWTGANGFSSQDEDLSGLSPGSYQLTIEAGCNNPPVIEPPPLASVNSKVSLELTSIISDPENNLDVNSITIVDPPKSLAKASITENKMLEVDYSGISFKGTDKLRIRACDLLNACTDNLITIEVDGNDNVIVYNAVAPHSTGENKFMRIENLPENNRVFIFNRWGDVVFEVDRYNDQNPNKRFEGMASSGKSLPSGTYLYKIEIEGKAEPVTGYLSLKQ